MTFLTTTVDRLETASTRLLDRLALSPRLSAAALLALALLSYLPGMLALPPVDRTEVVYAQASRDMIGSGNMIDPTYEGERVAFRPIGIHWLQVASGEVLGSTAQRAIATYRLPSLLGGVLAVLAMWWLARPLIGDRRALISAALFAVTPIVALQAQLSIPEGPLLLAPLFSMVEKMFSILDMNTLAIRSAGPCSEGWRARTRLGPATAAGTERTPPRQP